MNDKPPKSWFERRKYPRYRVQSNVLVVVSTDYTIMGPVIDVSEGGLAFSYIDQDIQDLKMFTLCLVIPDTGIILDSVPVSIVSDLELNNGEENELSILTRRCGVQFHNLSEAHLSQLDHLIQHHTLTG